MEILLLFLNQRKLLGEKYSQKPLTMNDDKKSFVVDNGAFHNVIESIRQGKYSNARKMLELEKDSIGPDYFRTCAFLELSEYNFLDSLDYYHKCFSDLEKQSKYLLDMANVYMELGNYDIARDMCETLSDNASVCTKSIFQLGVLDILQEEYRHALKLLESIAIDKLNSKDI